VIRQYRESDIDAVVEIFRSNIPKYFGPSEEPELREFLAAFGELYSVIEVDGNVVGAGGIGLNDDDTVSLCWGMVHREHLGTGVGKILTQYRIERSREVFGDKPIVTSTSQLTEGFYERFGLKTFERNKDAFGPGLDECKMRLG
jgi:ribosomal-protein-alanine N-acetyltransferase